MTNIIRYTASVVTGAILALGILSAAHFLVPSSVHAAVGDTTAVGTGALTTSDLLPTTFTSNTGLGGGDIQSTIANLIKTAIRFLGVIAVIFVLYGGFKWMTANGSDEKVSEAKRILIAALIGLAIVLTALAITNFAIGSILTATGTQTVATP